MDTERFAYGGRQVGGRTGLLMFILSFKVMRIVTASDACDSCTSEATLLT